MKCNYNYRVLWWHCKISGSVKVKSLEMGSLKMSRTVISLLQTPMIFRGSLLQLCRTAESLRSHFREERQKSDGIADKRVRLHHRKQKGTKVVSRSVDLRMKR